MLSNSRGQSRHIVFHLMRLVFVPRWTGPRAMSSFLMAPGGENKTERKETPAFPSNLSLQKSAKITKKRAFQRISRCLVVVQLLELIRQRMALNEAKHWKGPVQKLPPLSERCYFIVYRWDKLANRGLVKRR